MPPPRPPVKAPAASGDPASGAPTPLILPKLEHSRWAVPTWLMLAATLWSVFILWQALFNWDQTAIGMAGGQRPWMIPMLIVISGVCSFVAFAMLRDGSLNSVRVPLWLAALTGLQGIVVTACALVCLWMVWRARMRAQWEARGVPMGPAKRRRGAG